MNTPRTRTRYLDATRASVHACPDGVAIMLFEKPGQSAPSVCAFFTRRQWASLKRQELKRPQVLPRRNDKAPREAS